MKKFWLGFILGIIALLLIEGIAYAGFRMMYDVEYEIEE